MKRLLIGTVAFALLGAASAQDTPKLETVTEKFSYAMGYRMARDLLSKGLKNLDTKAMTQGMSAALSGQSFPYDQEQLNEIMTAYRTLLETEQASRATSNAAAGSKFMAENETADGVKTLPGGIQYKVLTEGSGDKPAETDTVRVHYSGQLLDGTEFDSSYKRGEPTELGLQGVIPGWRAALAAMPVGSKWTVWIPPDMAYGPGGAGGIIGPNSTLRFDIELLDVVTKN